MKQNKDPQIQTTDGMTPAQKATAGVMATGLVVGALAGGPNGHSHQEGQPVQGAEPSVDLVVKTPPHEVYHNSASFKGPDGKTTYRWFVDEAGAGKKDIAISEDGDGGFKAENARSGNPLSFNLQLPTPDTEVKGSPEQDKDPNTSIEGEARTPQVVVDAITKKGGNAIVEQPLTIIETGQGGLRAEDEAGNPVVAPIHFPTSGGPHDTEPGKLKVVEPRPEVIQK